MDAEKNVRLNFSLAEVILRGCFRGESCISEHKIR